METTIANEVQLIYKRKDNIEFKKITSPQELDYNFRKIFDGGVIDHKEYFYCIALNRKNEVIDYIKISEGGLTGTFVDIRNIFQFALLKNAEKIAVAHNHPSGQAKPSDSDIKLTKQIIDAGKIMSIELIDHLIITADEYYSFKDEGIIY